jgi:ferritin-like metal-binding protein YciE
MAIRTLQDLFVQGLMDMHHAERQLCQALPRFARAADSTSLRQALEQHGRETEGHVAKLDRAFNSLDLAPRGVRCNAISQMVRESEEMIGEVEHGRLRDACLIAAAQKVEHYEIGSYVVLHGMAGRLGLAKAQKALEDLLEEERRTAGLLEDIAAALPLAPAEAQAVG